MRALEDEAKEAKAKTEAVDHDDNVEQPQEQTN